MPGICDAIDKEKVCYGNESSWTMIARNVGVRSCAKKHAKTRSRDDALRVWKGNKRDHSTSADDDKICTWQPAVVTQYTATAI